MMSTVGLRQPVTTSLAVMLGWMLQKKSKLSAATRLKLLPGSMTPESVPPDLAVTVCGAVSSLSNTTVVPLATVSVPGWNFSPAMATVFPPPPAPPPSSAAAAPDPAAAPSRSQTMTTGPAAANTRNSRTTRIPASLARRGSATSLMLSPPGPSRPTRAAGIYQTRPRPGSRPSPTRLYEGCRRKGSAGTPDRAAVREPEQPEKGRQPAGRWRSAGGRQAVRPGQRGVAAAGPAVQLDLGLEDLAVELLDHVGEQVPALARRLLGPPSQPAHRRRLQLGQLLVDGVHTLLDLGDAADRPLQLGQGAAAGHGLRAALPVREQPLQGRDVALLVGEVGRHHQDGAPLPLGRVAGEVGMDDAGELAEPALGVLADHRARLRLRLPLATVPVLPTAGQALAGVALGGVLRVALRRVG